MEIKKSKYLPSLSYGTVSYDEQFEHIIEVLVPRILLPFSVPSHLLEQKQKN